MSLLALGRVFYWQDMNKTDKTVFIDNLSSDLKSVHSAILVNYSGLSVDNQQELKKRLKAVNARFIVVKNTLFRLAAEKSKLPSELSQNSIVSGQNALILADDDPVKPLSVIAGFAKEFELPQIKVGLVEGFFQDESQLASLAKLGGKDAIIAQLVGLMSAPTYAVVGTLQAKLQELTFILDSMSKK